MENMKANSSNININNNILIINKFASEEDDPLDQFKSQNISSGKFHNSNCNMHLERGLSASGPYRQKNSSISKKVRVSFVDKVNKQTRLVDMVEIESFKQFNMMEETTTSNSQKNSCCFVY